MSWVEILTAHLDLFRYPIGTLDGDGNIVATRDKFVNPVQIMGRIEIDRAIGVGILCAMTVVIDVECDSVFGDGCRVVNEIDGRLDVDVIDR